MKVRFVTTLVIVLLLIPTFSALGQAGGGERFTGMIDNEQPYVRIPFTVPEDGMTIIADMAPPEGGELDTLLYLLDDQDNILAENDDREKGDPSSLITFYQADAGNYVLVATRYKVADGDSTGEYELTLELTQGTETPEYHVANSDLEAAGFPMEAPRDEAEWTILAYYGGDNNLEGGILYDLDEFEVGGGSTDRVNVIALVDRNPRYTDSDGDWTTARLYRVEADVTGDHDDEETFPPTIDTVELADLGEVDTSNGEQFAQFLVWAIQHYPAKHYVVAFGSHGAAWNGLIVDDSTAGDAEPILTIPELRQAFTLAAEAAGVDRFDLLVNDACLMSSIEYFGGVAPFFDYALASPEVVVDPALDMTVLLETLQQADEVDLEAAGIELVDLYIERDVPKRGTAEVVYLTHAVINLQEFDPVVTAVENFARIVNRRPAVYSTLIGDVRTNTYAYTEFLGEQFRIDLGSFMRGIIANSTDAQLINAAEAVLEAMDVARVYENAGERAREANLSYYNIYFPDLSKDFKNEYFEESPLQEWAKMLRNYYNSVTPQVWSGVETELGFHLPAAPQITITRAFPPDEASVMDPVSLELELVGRRISYGEWTVDYQLEDGTVVRYTSERLLTDVEVDGRLQRQNVWGSGVQHVPWFWDVTLPVISDGSGEFNELLIIKEDVAFLDGRYREPGSDTWNDVAVMFNVNADFTGGVVQRVINRSEDTNALAVIDIAPGSEFQSYRAVVTPEGRVLQEPGNIYAWPESGLTWRWQPAPTGEYNLGLLITTFGGTTGFASKKLYIDNTGIDSTLRGRTISSYMVTVPRRLDWDRWVFDNDNRWYRTTSPDAADNLTIYFSTDYGPDLVDIADRFFERYERTPESDYVETTFAGGDALEFDYSYETEAGRTIGHGYAVYHPVRELEMVFTAEALEGVGDLEASLEILNAHSKLVDLTPPDEALMGAQGIVARAWDFEKSTDQWVYGDGFAQRNVQYPYRLDWYPLDFDIFTLYLPPTDYSGASFVATTGLTLGEDLSPAAIQSTILDTYVTPDVSDLTTSRRTYYGDYHTWDVLLYTGMMGDAGVTGRIYVIVIDNRAYVVLMQAPNEEGVVALFAAGFEPLVDGFVIGEP